MSRTTLALIGAGAIGRMHVERARLHPDCEIVAVADPSPAAEAFARAEGLRWFADYTAMLDEVKPRGAIVATPNATHLQVGLACIERGRRGADGKAYRRYRRASRTTDPRGVASASAAHRRTSSAA